MIAPTGQQLSDCLFEQIEDAFELVHETTSPARHGYAYVMIFKRKADGTFWKVHGRSASDNDYNTLRDTPEEVSPIHVLPQQRTITEYVAAKVAEAMTVVMPAPTPAAMA